MSTSCPDRCEPSAESSPLAAIWLSMKDFIWSKLAPDSASWPAPENKALLASSDSAPPSASMGGTREEGPPSPPPGGMGGLVCACDKDIAVDVKSLEVLTFMFGHLIQSYVSSITVNDSRIPRLERCGAGRAVCTGDKRQNVRHASAWGCRVAISRVFLIRIRVSASCRIVSELPSCRIVLTS